MSNEHLDDGAAEQAGQPPVVDAQPRVDEPEATDRAEGKIRLGGYIFISWKSDHPPRHVHVYREGKLIVSGIWTAVGR
jgi:hypothetical protein